jgi:hypothetical protein
MWTQEQSSGHLISPEGEVYAMGYSGHGAGVDNPADQNIPNVGPVPVGLYTIGAPVNGTHLGDGAMPLTPDPTNVMFGRSGFWMHQDNVKHDESASEGCIVQILAVLQAVAASSDKRLQVVP